LVAQQNRISVRPRLSIEGESLISELEIVTITLSFVLGLGLGLGVTQILTGIVDLVRSPKPVKLDWMPLAWAWFIFVFHVQVWFGIFEMGQGSGIAGPLYLLLLAAAIMLFLGGGLVLPSQGRGLPDSLLNDFDRFGRRALVPFGGFLILAVAVNTMAAGGVLLEDANLFDLTLLILTLIVFFTSRRRFQRTVTVAFFAVQTYGFIFIFARPGS